MVNRKDKLIIGQCLVDVLSRHRIHDKSILKDLSDELSELLKKKVTVGMDYIKKGTFGNDNIRFKVLSNNGNKKKLASFLLKAYPLQNNYFDRLTRVDRVEGKYGHYWLSQLEQKSLNDESDLGLPTIYGFKEDVIKEKKENGKNRSVIHYNLELLEDLGDNSLEKVLFSTKDKVKKLRLLKRAIKSVVKLHLVLDSISKYGGVRKLEDYVNESVSNIDYYLRNIRYSDLTDWDEKGKLLLKKALNPICDSINDEPRRIIHLDLHPGNLLDSNKIVDFDHIGWGPYQFDLVDLLKHPATGYKGYNQRVNKLVKFYLSEKILQLPELSSEKLGNIDKGSIVDNDYLLNFLRVFYFSNIIRDIRAIGFSSWLRGNNKMSLEELSNLKSAYQERLRVNSRYETYRSWYLKDLEMVFNSLLNKERSKHLALKEGEYESLAETRSILKNYKIIK